MSVALTFHELARRMDGSGETAFELRDKVARHHGVTVADLVSRIQSGPANTARQACAFRLWTECRHLTLNQVARLIGRADHSAAIHAILAGARSRGLIVSRVSELREHHGDDLDWTKLAYHTAGHRETLGLTLETVAARAGVSRAEWRKVENGRSVSAGTLLRICRQIAADPMSFLPDTHETAVKHPSASRAVSPPAAAGAPAGRATGRGGQSALRATPGGEP
jgi:DNA-binding XRE family transcriptional regulator